MQLLITDIILDVHAEVVKAKAKHKPMASLHEGYAVILEELDELWTEIKKYPKHDRAAVKEEAYHVAAMAVRFIHDLCDEDSNG